MKIQYRPEIDGLRAIAVLSVIAYHSMFPQKVSNLFHGGFIGVDIFFTISGYLITKIILKEIIKQKNFLLKVFMREELDEFCPHFLLLFYFSYLFLGCIFCQQNLLIFQVLCYHQLGSPQTYIFILLI